jgi:hypothetical protein
MATSTFDSGSDAARIERSFFSKETLQNRCAFIFQNARSDLASVIERRELREIDNASSRAGQRVCAAENDPVNSHVNECARAHRARFLRHVKVAISQAPISYGSFRLRQREHFGMRGCVLQQFNLIIGARDNFPGPHNDCADWHFVGFVGLCCLSQRFAHEGFVAWQINHHFRHVTMVKKVTKLQKRCP